MRYGLTITVNHADGREENDIETSCDAVGEIGPTVLQAIRGASTAPDDPEWSSVVVVVIPLGAEGFGALKLKDLKAGDELIVDGGFTCIKGGTKVVLEQDDSGLFFMCHRGRSKHHIDGQINENGRLSGLKRAEPKPA